MDGRVLDASTGVPISGATIAIHDSPNFAVKSDQQGRFHVEKQKNYHLAYDVNFVGGPGSIGGKYWSYDLDVTAPGYIGVKISAPDHHLSYDEKAGSYVLRDIILSPEILAPKK